MHLFSILCMLHPCIIGDDSFFVLFSVDDPNTDALKGQKVEDCGDIMDKAQRALSYRVLHPSDASPAIIVKADKMLFILLHL